MISNIHFGSKVGTYGANQALFILDEQERSGLGEQPFAQAVDIYASANGSTLELKPLNGSWQSIQDLSTSLGAKVETVFAKVNEWVTNSGDSFTDKPKFLANLQKWKETHPTEFTS